MSIKEEYYFLNHQKENFVSFSMSNDMDCESEFFAHGCSFIRISYIPNDLSL